MVTRDQIVSIESFIVL